jgi:hypothetical protein
MTSIIKVEQTSFVNAINARSGAMTVRPQNAKEFKEAYKKANPDAGNRAIKAAFEEYFVIKARELGKGLDIKKLLVLQETGDLGLKRVSPNKDGDEITMVVVDLSGSKKKENVDIDKMSVEQMQELLRTLSSKLEAIQDGE